MKETYVQRNYKDTLFRMLFKEKENLLSLYNALNGTSYTDAEELEITTLENAVYMNYKNDVSFVLGYEMMLYEHQSTINPNMPSFKRICAICGIGTAICKRTVLPGSGGKGGG